MPPRGYSRRLAPGSLWRFSSWGTSSTSGIDEGEWRIMGSLIDGLRSEGIPVNAILGNHEVMFFATEGEGQFQRRLPSHRRTGYVKIVDSMAVVLLNSNVSIMDDVALDSQQRWYQQTMTDLSRDPGIAAIVVTCHHSPFTNSILVGSSLQSQERFVPRFLAEPKARLFMSGHAHVFEHFRKEGKDFLVIGGGAAFSIRGTQGTRRSTPICPRRT